MKTKKEEIKKWAIPQDKMLELFELIDDDDMLNTRVSHYKLWDFIGKVTGLPVHGDNTYMVCVNGTTAYVEEVGDDI